MGFADDMNRFNAKLEQRHREVFVGVASAVENSITEGSPLTGAPGQPIDKGVLIASWQLSFEEEWVALIGSGGAAADYNRSIEDGEGPHGPLTLRSSVGGFHSVALTRAGFQPIVDDVAAKVNG